MRLYHVFIASSSRLTASASRVPFFGRDSDAVRTRKAVWPGLKERCFRWGQIYHRKGHFQWGSRPIKVIETRPQKEPFTAPTIPTASGSIILGHIARFTRSRTCAKYTSYEAGRCGFFKRSCTAIPVDSACQCSCDFINLVGESLQNDRKHWLDTALNWL